MVSLEVWEKGYIFLIYKKEEKKQERGLERSQRGMKLPTKIHNDEETMFSGTPGLGAKIKKNTRPVLAQINLKG